MSEDSLKNQKETDLLKYESNKVPLVLVFVWIVLMVFAVYYLKVYSWEDLKVWINLLGAGDGRP
jgi:hypothetical protein